MRQSKTIQPNGRSEVFELDNYVTLVTGRQYVFFLRANPDAPNAYSPLAEPWAFEVDGTRVSVTTKKEYLKVKFRPKDLSELTSIVEKAKR